MIAKFGVSKILATSSLLAASVVMLILTIALAEAAAAPRQAVVDADWACDGTVTARSDSKAISNIVIVSDVGHVKLEEPFEDAELQEYSFASNDYPDLVAVYIKAGNNRSGDGPGYGERVDLSPPDCGDPTCPVVLFEETFKDNAAGWSLEGEWQIQPATPSVPTAPGDNGDPATDTTPTTDNGIAGTVVGFGGNYFPFLHPPFWLTSWPIDTTSHSGPLTLNFQRWLNSDYTPFVNNYVQVFDGSTWVTIWESGGAPGVTDDSWQDQTFDISAFSNPALRVRFGLEIGSSGFFRMSGWNLDDLRICGH